MVAVTKTYPASDVAHLITLGVTDVGENRDQEAAPKAAEVSAAGLSARWHYIGQLQRNKCRSVAAYADVVQSVDRLSLVTALAMACDARSGVPPMDVLLQISLDGRESRGGADPADVATLAEAIAASGSLRLAGVMAVAPLGVDPAGPFRRLVEVSTMLQVAYPEASVVSAGMSADLEAAISHGATHVRVGSALLGTRPPLG